MGCILILISHRGNVDGKTTNENKPTYIKRALRLGYDVEIDVWFHQHGFYLGHDEPQYRVDESFLENSKLWCHAKNIDALNKMMDNKKIHCFWHQEDDVTLTSKGYLWTYPGKELTEKSIAVALNKKAFKWVTNLVAGVCSDYIGVYHGN